MQCPKCGKESNNLRVCPFCHEPYPEAEGGARPTPRASFAVAPQAAPRPSSAGIPMPRKKVGFVEGVRGAVVRQPPAVRWGAVVLLVAYAGWYVMAGRERSIPAGAVLPNIIAAPMPPAQAEALMRQFHSKAKIDASGSGITVQFPEATFPLKREGQLALAQQFARADEIVEGHKRAIEFRDAAGQAFARSDPVKGVMMVR